MKLPNPLERNADRSLSAEEQLLDTLEDASYWRKLCPHLHVGEGKHVHNLRVDGEAEKKHKDLTTCGFFHLEREDLGLTEELVDALALGVVQLMQHGWAPSFIFVYDEAWEVIDAAEKLLQRASGGSLFLGDLYAWYVDAERQEKGWGPHRDRMGSGPESFREDGSPMLSTTWLALTDAGPNNSCLYVVPKGEDPYYLEQDLPDVDPLAAIFAGRPDAYQSIRALPCPKGCAWHFSHKIIHWGSYVDRPSTLRAPCPPRIAMSWVIGDDRFEQPAFPRSHLPFPSIPLRVAFVMAQQIAYGGQTGLRKGLKSMYYRFFKLHADKFTEFYRDKVEFIFFCRPPPPKEVQLKERTKMQVDVSELEFATPEDDSKLDGLQGMFGSSDSSSSESDSEEEEEEEE